jgi:uncharacterized protein involved in propanediol utilization
MFYTRVIYKFCVSFETDSILFVKCVLFKMQIKYYCTTQHLLT